MHSKNNWCPVEKGSWQNLDNTNDDRLWDIDTVDERVAINTEHNYTDERMMGVRSSPWFKIPFARIIFAVLHGMIGIGGVLVKDLELFIDKEIEKLSNKEYYLRQTKASGLGRIEALRAEKKVWTESYEGGRLLEKKRRRVKKLKSQVQGGLALSLAEEEEMERLEAETLVLVATRNLLSKKITTLQDQITKATEELESFSRKQRSGEESVYTEVDRIFQEFGANRSHYFGRAFQGVDIRKIMNKSKDLFGVDGKIRKCLLSHVAKMSISEDEREILIGNVNKKCDDVGQGLLLWDGVFSHVHRSHPNEAHCVETQDRIDAAMAHMRDMGLSITPKMHGMEKHVVNQMRATRGGIGRLVEHWIEHYHQVGYRYDVAYDRVGSPVKAAEIRAKAEKRSRQPQVQLNKNLLHTFVKRKMKKVKESKHMVQIKQERRDQAFEKFKSDKLDAATIYKKIDQMEKDDEQLELNDLEARLFGIEISS
jgi:hypothetical protein